MDLIDRQAALDSIDEDIKACERAIAYFVANGRDDDYGEVEKATLTRFREKLEKLPSAQVERKKGKWIFVESVYKHDGWDSDIYRCNQCHRRTELRVVLKRGEDITDYKRYCESCGALMEGVDDKRVSD